MVQEINSGVQAMALHLAKVKRECHEAVETLAEKVKLLEEDKSALLLQLESVLDELDYSNGQVAQLRLENSKKWRVEERNDWMALVDSVQRDRDELQLENERLNKDLEKIQQSAAHNPEFHCATGAEDHPSSVYPSSPSLRQELHETRTKLELERSILALERLEARRLRQELSARRERDRRQGGSGFFFAAGLSKISQLLGGKSPLLFKNAPLDV